MKPKRTRLPLLLASVMLLAPAAVEALLRSDAGGEANAPPDRPVIVIFDFASPAAPGLGEKLADALRLRAARLGKLTVIDTVSMREALAGGESPAPDAPPEKVALLARRCGAELALWGSARREGDATTIDAVGLDLRPGAAQPILRKSYVAEKPQLVNARCDELLADLTGVEKATRPKEADPEAAARAKVKPQNLVTNGDFEKIAGDPKTGLQPKGWDRIDGLTSFIDKLDDAHGRVLHLDTDVYESEAKRWQERLSAGAPLSEAPKKTPTRGPKYDTVGGNYGVHLHSDPIPVAPGKTYRVEIDYRCKTGDFFFPKLFMRGYAEVESPPPQSSGDRAGQERVVYDGYLALRSMEKTGEWKHNARLLTIPKPEELGGRQVKYLRLMLFAYWPPGDYYFDNVGLYEVLEPTPEGSGPAKP